MRAKITMFVSAVVLMLGVLSVAQPAAAAPAESYHVSQRQDFSDDDSGNVYTHEIVNFECG